MTTRDFTVNELMALRHAVENKQCWGRYAGPHCKIGVVQQGRITTVSDVEQIVRTHMLAGHTAQDLLDSEADLPPYLTHSRETK